MELTMHARYGLKRVVNASGRMSILGVSAPTNTVMEAVKEGGQKYVEISDLVIKSGKYVANALNAEDAVIVNSASSGIALSVAALVTKGNERKSLKLHQEIISKNQIIMYKGHNVQYGTAVETMIALGGGQLVEVGYANEGRIEHIEQAVTEHTAAILFVKSHHCVQKNMATAEEVSKLARKLNIPFIIDAAAEEDLHKYVQLADIAIYSGSKAIEGPTSGIVAGKAQYMSWVRTQLHGIGRSMKVGKESVFGLLQALDEYFVKKDNSEQEKELLKHIMTLADIDGVSVSIVHDEAGRAIFRGRVKIDEQLTGVDAITVNEQLQSGAIAVYTRDYGVKQGYFDIDPRSLADDDIFVIVSRIREIIGGNPNG